MRRKLSILVCLLAASAAAGLRTAERADLPSLRLIATGGTIANRGGNRLSADELLRLIPGIDRSFRIQAEQFSNVGSASLSIAQWLQLGRRINDLFAREPDLDGIVVTSGTDTLEEIAYFLHLTVRSDRPVVVVGSMRGPEAVGYDGAANLLQAFRVAAEPSSRNKGALVVMNGEINSAREVAKTDTQLLQTFQSRPYGVLGIVDEDRVLYYRSSLRRHTVQSEFDISKLDSLPRVDILMVYQGASGDLIAAAVNAGAKGIVIASAGAGTTSGAQRDAIAAATGRKVFVVVSSRTGSGRVTDRSDGDQRSGAGQPYTISAEDLAPLKARILLMLALTKTSDTAEIQRIFNEY